MTPSERIKLIKEITSKLGKDDWTMVNVTLRQFRIRTIEPDEFYGGLSEYIPYMLEGISDQKLIDLSQHLEINLFESPSSISHKERHGLINDIAYELQSSMVTTDINVFLTGFGVVTEEVTIVPSKRVYVQNLLKGVDSSIIIKIAHELNIVYENFGLVSVENIQELITNNDLKSVMDDFNRALKNIENDPEQAIASSSSTLESICKAIIELEGRDSPKKLTISKVLSEAFKIVNFDPKNHSEGEIKRILGGIQNVILGIGALRSGFSSAHGHGIKKYRLSERHVRLLVNSMITFGMFLLESYIQKRKSLNNI